MPEASSATSKMFRECKPAIASGVSGRDVRAVTKHSLSLLSVMWSVVTSHSACHCSGMRPIHLRSSGHSTSNSCGALGAVRAHLNGARVQMNHSTTHAAKQLFPTPVSYTHLRAHETPEHLVCRLLLEKKKD